RSTSKPGSPRLTAMASHGFHRLSSHRIRVAIPLAAAQYDGFRVSALERARRGERREAREQEALRLRSVDPPPRQLGEELVLRCEALVLSPAAQAVLAATAPDAPAPIVVELRVHPRRAGLEALLARAERRVRGVVERAHATVDEGDLDAEVVR